MFEEGWEGKIVMSLRDVPDDRTDCCSADYSKALDRFILGHVLWRARGGQILR